MEDHQKHMLQDLCGSQWDMLHDLSIFRNVIYNAIALKIEISLNFWMAEAVSGRGSTRGNGYGGLTDAVWMAKARRNAEGFSSPGPKFGGLEQISALRTIKFVCRAFDPMMSEDGDLRCYEKGIVNMGFARRNRSESVGRKP
jgi:hypothetical protein